MLVARLDGRLDILRIVVYSSNDNQVLDATRDKQLTILHKT